MHWDVVMKMSDAFMHRSRGGVWVLVSKAFTRVSPIRRRLFSYTTIKW